MNKLSAEQIRFWAEKISESDREAFDCLFRSLYPRLMRYAFRYTQSKAVASDIVQDTFVILWEKRHEVDPQQSPKSYLYSIVRNRSLNYIRDHANETVGLEPVSESLLRSTGQTGWQEEPDNLADMLKRWIKDLPERQREAFELSRFEGLDHDEIAAVMGVSSSTVNNHIVAALNYLRNRHDAYQRKQVKNND